MPAGPGFPWSNIVPTLVQFFVLAGLADGDTEYGSVNLLSYSIRLRVPGINPAPLIPFEIPSFANWIPPGREIRVSDGGL